MVRASSGQLTPAVPGSPAALSHSSSMTGGCLQLGGGGGGMLDGDLGDLVASFQKDGGQDGLGPLFLSDSDDASDGTQLSLGRMWGGGDVFDGIFDDVDAMDSESYGSKFGSHIPDCSMVPDSSLLACDLAAPGATTAPAFIQCEALSSSSSDSVFASPPLMGTTAGCGTAGPGLLPVVSCGDLIHHGLGEGPGGFGVSCALSITHGGAMPAIPRCASTLLLQHIPTPVVAPLSELPASLVQIPAKTNGALPHPSPTLIPVFPAVASPSSMTLISTAVLLLLPPPLCNKHTMHLAGHIELLASLLPRRASKHSPSGV